MSAHGEIPSATPRESHLDATKTPPPVRASSFVNPNFVADMLHSTQERTETNPFATHATPADEDTSAASTSETPIADPSPLLASPGSSQIRLNAIASSVGHPSRGTSANTLGHLLVQNRKWAARMESERPGWFKSLAEQQAPEILWIGCSDSRVPANTITGLSPGEVFVHRNIANVIPHTDFNALSVLQYAVEYLKVKHIIVCGHYGCGGVKAAYENKQLGTIDNWLRHIKDIYESHYEEISSLEDPQARVDFLVELNVAKSVLNVVNTTIVQNAWARGQELCVHGWCYTLSDGHIHDLGLHIDSPRHLSPVFVAFEKSVQRKASRKFSGTLAKMGIGEDLRKRSGGAGRKVGGHGVVEEGMDGVERRTEMS
ncbi:carbonic anhydrase [Gonapodya prolifera JEL478]|uniref:Carbonic anhydrase n=1 Tax=Gonapodya prolifera (strain JEL478) TaxID=1344416 RepID=A0A139AIT5_GONPJ|nr:carbonic anhydrase [Gonapodya prolifera JEL478]|eukprot:KXS16721.1 carbonic anhydrase [Gonapodya prolifera JEL478]